MYILTTGCKFADIDAFACLYAYKELLDLEAKPNEVIIEGELNYSIVSKYKKYKFYKTQFNYEEFNRNFSVIIVDVSNPEMFPKFVKEGKVAEVIDHHKGFEEYWYERIGDRAIIEWIGAAATLVWRRYKKSGMHTKISPISAELLAAAIISNTLNFQAKITQQEDKDSYEELKSYFEFHKNFEENYFKEVQNAIEDDLLSALKNDSKIENNLMIGQLEIWKADKLFKDKLDVLQQFLNSSKKEYSFLNLIEIGKNRNIIMCKDKKTYKFIINLTRKFSDNLKFDDKKLLIYTPNVILRKELLNQLIN